MMCQAYGYHAVKDCMIACLLFPQQCIEVWCGMCRKMGLQSLPVAFGVDTAKWITVGTIDITQFAVAAYLLFGLNEPLYGGILTALILPQVHNLDASKHPECN